MVSDPEPWGNDALVELEQRSAWVTTSRPAPRNAMSPALSTEMHASIEALITGERFGILVPTGAGG